MVWLLFFSSVMVLWAFVVAIGGVKETYRLIGLIGIVIIIIFGYGIYLFGIDQFAILSVIFLIGLAIYARNK